MEIPSALFGYRLRGLKVRQSVAWRMREYRRYQTEDIKRSRFLSLLMTHRIV